MTSDAAGMQTALVSAGLTPSLAHMAHCAARPPASLLIGATGATTTLVHTVLHH